MNHDDKKILAVVKTRKRGRKKIGRHGIKAWKFLMGPGVKIRKTVPR